MWDPWGGGQRGKVGQLGPGCRPSACRELPTCPPGHQAYTPDIHLPPEVSEREAEREGEAESALGAGGQQGDPCVRVVSRELGGSSHLPARGSPWGLRAGKGALTCC